MPTLRRASRRLVSTLHTDCHSERSADHPSHDALSPTTIYSRPTTTIVIPNTRLAASSRVPRVRNLPRRVRSSTNTPQAGRASPEIELESSTIESDSHLSSKNTVEIMRSMRRLFWPICFITLALAVVGLLYRVTPLSKRTGPLRASVAAENGGYRAIILNDGFLPVVVGRYETVSDAMEKDITVGKAQRG